MYQHNQHQKHQEPGANSLDPGTKWQKLLDYLAERVRRADQSIRSVDPHLGFQETQAKLLRNLEELKTLESIQKAAILLNLGKNLPSSRAGDFLQADGIEVTDDDLYEDV